MDLDVNEIMFHVVSFLVLKVTNLKLFSLLKSLFECSDTYKCIAN